MSYSLKLSRRFQGEAKRLIRKYPSLQSELTLLRNSLLANPIQGTPIGHNCFKIRLAIYSKGRGKSGGARVITYVHIIGEVVYLLSIYDKSEMENLSADMLLKLLDEIED